MTRRVLLVGFGAWGKALLKVMSESYSKPRLLVYTRQNKSEVIEEIKLITQDEVEIVDNLQRGIDNCDTIVIATRAHEVEGLFSDIDNIKNCLITSKGFSKSGQLLSKILMDKEYRDIGMLSGPNFACEIVEGKPTKSTIASTNPELFSYVLNGDSFKTESVYDVIGAQVCGVLKNIFAIGSGLINKSFMSANLNATFITKAFKELKIGIEWFGGSIDTANTTAGIGDFILTCYSKNSRNFLFGEKFADVPSLDNIGTVEGYTSLLSIDKRLLDKMPICRGINDVINQKISLNEFCNIILS